jgi:hypothetical protein
MFDLLIIIAIGVRAPASAAAYWISSIRRQFLQKLGLPREGANGGSKNANANEVSLFFVPHRTVVPAAGHVTRPN